MRKKRVDEIIFIAQSQAMEQDRYHYQVVARAIEFIDENRDQQPSLDEIAAAASLSPAHFQRIFSQWAGVSPKRYQQYLTLDLAKSLLRDQFTVLDTAAETGLSGSSRVHDMFHTWEAMTPGEYAAKGKGMNIDFSWCESPFGKMLVMATPKGICGLAFSDECGEQEAMRDLTSRWPEANFIENDYRLHPLVQSLLTPNGTAEIHMIGAPFQIKVWEALMRIPSGQVTTYSEIAKSIGHPKAVRAVGTAVGKNPVSWLIPCHRALRKSGGLGGYHWGIPVKKALLMREAMAKTG